MRLKCCATLFCRINNFSKNSINLTQQPSVLLSINRTFSQWEVVGAVCLERKPVISQSLSPLEQKYFKYIQKLEVEKSYTSDHEKRQIDDQRVAEKFKAGLLEDADVISKKTSHDFEDACTEELKKYKPASRITEADATDDKHSTQRKLDSSLVFVTKQKLGNDFKWAFPQAVHEEGETLRQTAERALSQAATCHSKVQFMGNAPVGYYKYKYPKVVRGNGICGAKVFFFKARLLDAKENALTLKEADSLSDYLWLTHSELEDVLQPVLCKTVQSFLYPDILNDESGVDTSSRQQTDEDEHISSVVSQG